MDIRLFFFPRKSIFRRKSLLFGLQKKKKKNCIALILTSRSEARISIGFGCCCVVYIKILSFFLNLAKIQFCFHLKVNTAMAWNISGPCCKLSHQIKNKNKIFCSYYKERVLMQLLLCLPLTLQAASIYLLFLKGYLFKYRIGASLLNFGYLTGNFDVSHGSNAECLNTTVFGESQKPFSEKGQRRIE